MKKLNLYGLFLLAFLTFSCSNETEEVGTTDMNLKSGTTRYTPEQFEIFGVKHNEGLDYFFQKFKNSTVATPEDYKALMIKSTKEYAVSYIDSVGDKSDPAFAINIAENYEMEKMDFTNNFYEDIPNADQISLNAREYLDRLHKTLYVIEEGATVDQLIAKIEVMEQDAYNDKALDNKDLTFVYTASSIATSSLQYWDDHLVEWDNTFHDQGFFDGHPEVEPLGAGSDTLKAIGIVAATDVAGGVVAAGATWAVNVFFPPPGGQAAYGAAILSGAIRSSGMAAAGMIIGEIFELW